MFIIFDKTIKTIYSYGVGNPTESDNKLILNGNPICNDLSVCGWKYIADQRLETDENGACLHDADYYEAVTPTDRLADIEAALLDLAEAIL
ncbi:MAG: hypothetical protein BWY95_02232 [Bacteroidetes bacterium ADurb.BinA104]|nr:MAG: hypothetical protein BWY95_02232 [Bacteroidetes bacterium ADurb.BinA104]